MKKYYKDYRPVIEVPPDGRMRQKVEYTGKYYSYLLTEEQFKRKKIQYVILTLCISAIEIGIGFLNNPGSRMFYIVLPYVALFLPTIYCIIGTGVFVKSRITMEYAVFDKSRNRIYRSTVAQIVFGIMVIIGDLCFIVIRKYGDNTAEELIFIIGMLLLVLLCVFFIHIQKRIKYQIH